MKTDIRLESAQWIKLLKDRQSIPSQSPVVAVFDGFVDEIISVVGERTSLSEWKPVPLISQFGDLIKAAAGRSSLREIIVHRADPGEQVLVVRSLLEVMSRQDDPDPALPAFPQHRFEEFRLVVEFDINDVGQT